MHFTYNNNKVPFPPNALVPSEFGGDGVKTIAEDLGMNDEAISNAQREYELNTIHIRRASEYPSVQQQLDMLYHDIKNGKLFNGTWIESIDFIKSKYPKPE